MVLFWQQNKKTRRVRSVRDESCAVGADNLRVAQLARMIRDNTADKGCGY